MWNYNLHKQLSLVFLFKEKKKALTSPFLNKDDASKGFLLKNKNNFISGSHKQSNHKWSFQAP